MFLQSLLSRVKDAQAHLSASTLKVETFVAIKQGHREELDGLRNRLRVLLLIPFFFISPRDDGPSPVDARSILQPMDKLTVEAEARIRAPLTKAREFWNKGTAVIAWFHIIEAHVSSLTKNWDVREDLDSMKPALQSAWTPLVAAGTLYFGVVISLWHQEVTDGLRLTTYLSQMVMHDVLGSRAAMLRWDDEHCKLWFWKAFVVALCLSLEEPEARSPVVVALEGEARHCIQEWSAVSGITAWADARKALESMVWPRYLHLEVEAAKVWIDSVNPPRMA